MKKAIAVCLCVVLAVVFCACQTEKDPEKVTNDTIKDQISAGKIPEMEFRIGADAKDMTEQLQKRADESGTDEEGEPQTAFHVLEKSDYTKITNGDFQEFEYYYREDGKISCLVATDTAFGFPKMTVVSEVRESLAGLTADEQDGVSAFFLPAGEICDCLSYTVDGHTVTFAFAQSGLIATALYETDQWRIG